MEQCQPVKNEQIQDLAEEVEGDMIDKASNHDEDPTDELAGTSTGQSEQEEDLDEVLPEIGDPQYHAKQIQRTFRERCLQLKKEQQKKMVLSDQLDFKDPQNLSEFTDAIFNNMLKQEAETQITPHDYLKKVQSEIKDTQRAFLLEWIIDVHRKFRLKPECLYVTQYIIDSFMSKQ